ncbi:aminopeptidase P family protein [Butyrivibrio sp. MC2013]|uniref:aminopeptidase P family protein n=1 Tax=Butyrivibrio sp. MC2013 TaxID=1280686 RepID=UPI00041CA6DE|nr:aminopeptidase P family protein [Butyrivibrio sp. MC2013]
MENTKIRERLAALRSKMKEYGIDYYLMPTSDYHNSEYSADFFKAREFFTGFTGSNGTVVVAQDWAGLWTDGRYFIQAEKELEGTGVTLYRMGNEGVPTIKEYLTENAASGSKIGFDGKVVPSAEGAGYESIFAAKSGVVVYDKDLAAEVWADRPALPSHPLYLVPADLCGKSFEEKLSEVREKMEELSAKDHLICKLDDIMWLTNLRGNDVECNPVALSYAFITPDAFHFFVQSGEMTEEVSDYCREHGFTVHDYSEISTFLENYDYDGDVLVNKGNVSYAMDKALDKGLNPGSYKKVNNFDPTELMKAVKNETELKNIREVYLKDSAVLCRFIYYVKNNVGKEPMDEYSLAMKLDDMRAQLPGFIELSFPTISAYGPNAAMMHYEATREDHAEVKAEGMLLVDSGATYLGGTTDVTRTMVLGPISEEVKEHYTRSCMGMLRLAAATFLEGCTGRNLDILARSPLWDIETDYKCGTGHGIGYMLNVHEGPHNIRWAMRPGLNDAALQPGMIVSDEPGVYKEGSHGIRIENIIEVVKAGKNTDGQFLKFAHLTYAPIDLDAIDKKYMEERDVKLLNDYHKQVWEKVSPLIVDQEIKDWLKSATREI